MDPVMKQQLIFAGLLLAALLSISGITVLWPSNLSIRGAELQHADSNTGNSAPEGYKLMLAQVVFRHGARTPLNTIFFNDTKWDMCRSTFPGIQLQLREEYGAEELPQYSDKDAATLPGGCFMGQLTLPGYIQALSYGQQLRRRYIDELKLLPQQYLPGAIHAKSTMVRRTVATLQGVLSGLYTAGARPGSASGSGPGTAVPGRHGSSAHAQHSGRQLMARGGGGVAPGFGDGEAVVPVDVTDDAHEYLYGHNRSCATLGPIFAELEHKVEASEAASPALQALQAQVRAALGLPADQPLAMNRLRDVLAALKGSQLAWPEGMTPDLYRAIDVAAVQHEGGIYAPSAAQGLLPQEGCDRVLRLSIGPLVWRLVNNMKQAAACAAGQKQHDTAAGSSSSSSSSSCGQGGSRRMLDAASSTDSSSAADSGADGTGESDSSTAAVGSVEGSDCGPLLHLFSGHDTTVMPLLVALGHPVHSWPPFVAHVEFELWVPESGSASETSPPLVAVRYNGNPVLCPGGSAAGSAGGWEGAADSFAAATAAAAGKHPHMVSLDHLEKLLAGVVLGDAERSGNCTLAPGSASKAGARL